MRYTHLHPKYWPHWIALACIRPIVWLPYQTQLALGKYIGKIILRYNQRLRHVAQTNIRLCFPQLTKTEQAQLLQDNFTSLGISAIETLNALWPRGNRLQHAIHHIEGLAHIQDALDNKKGVLLLFPHFMSVYYVGYLLLQKIQTPFSLMYNKPKNAMLDHFMQKKMGKLCHKIFSRKDIKQMIQLLKNPNLVWYSPDLDLGRKVSVFSSFFAIPAATCTVTARVAAITGAKAIPIGFYRREDQRSYDIVFYPPLENFPSENDQQDADTINKTLEDIIKQKPSDYLWGYKRFNTRPTGEKKFYQKNHID